jgi:pre-mRNA-processing factor SLU7
MPPPQRNPPPPPPPSSRNVDGKASAASKEENVYIPSFISKRPFYAGEESEQTDYLEHQRIQKKEEQTSWYDRGKKAGPAATKYRKGACENCGAMTHKAKDCLERPRAKGAKFTGKNIKADDLVQDVRLGWDAKRDRWNGFDPKEYRAVVDEYNQMEDLRKQALRSQIADDPDGDNEKDDGDKYAEESDMSKHQSTATRQLRLREDTAKYLLNLDLDSAKYDPKTRTLVDAGAVNDKAANAFAEQGYMRATGDAVDFADAHLQANPTAGEFSRKKERDEAETKRAERQKFLADKYGGEQNVMPAALREMAVTESETFVEYDEDGLIKGAPKKVAKSKYPEDIFPNNHTTVWGSWWANFRWGYACCHSLLKNSYCTGEHGKKAWEATERQRTGAGLIKEDGEDESLEGADAGDAEDARQDPGASATAKKRTREEMMGGVSEAELDEYRRKRKEADDPMAKFLGKDELVH